MKKVHVFFSIIFIVSSSVWGQITFNKVDVQNIYAVGNSMISHQDTLTTNINIGAPGNNTWDFFNLGSHITMSNTSVNPSSTPFFNEFSAANYALQTPIDMMGIPTSYYSYINITDNGFNTMGAMAEISIPNMTVSSKIINTPFEKAFIFPLTYLTEWTDIYEETESSSINGIPMNMSTFKHTKHYKCDAYGMVRTPDNEIIPALRLREDEIIYEAETGYYNREISYEIVTLTGFSVTFTAVDTLAPNQDFIDIKDLLWSSMGTVKVQSELTTPLNFSIEQNYPNPFNPNTTIKFSIVEQAKVSLIIYDVLGNEVETLVNEELPSGTYSTKWSPSNNISGGIYFCKLFSGNLSKTIKMVYLK
jgi:hypothetical protein